MGIQATGNPVYSIKLRELGKNQRGFISSEEIHRVKKKYNAKSNCVVNVDATISPVNTDEYDVSVMGTGPNFDDFHIDMSSVILSSISDLKVLKKESEVEWIIFSSVLKPDVYVSFVVEDNIDELLDEYIDVVSSVERDKIEKKISKLLYIDYQKMNIDDLLKAREQLISSIDEMTSNIELGEKELSNDYDLYMQEGLNEFKEKLLIGNLLFTIFETYFRSKHCLDRLSNKGFGILIREAILKEDYEFAGKLRDIKKKSLKKRVNKN